MRRRGMASMVVLVVVAVAALAFTLLRGWVPNLGLDLQGGVSVVLQPTDDVDDGALDEAVAIIRQRVDALGVVEPEVTRQGQTIIVQIPGVEDRERALELVGQTAELRFRPVLGVVPANAELPASGAEGVETGQTVPASALLPPDVCREGLPPEADVADQPMTAPSCDGPTLVAVYQLGPTLLTGEALETASSGLGQQGQWEVRPIFRGGADGIDLFNQAAAACFQGDSTCPATTGTRGQMAVVLDGVVVSAPVIQASSFGRDQITISGSFDEAEAGRLATVLRYGALPVQLEPEQVQIVSATLGQDALQAGLWAGLVGFLLVVAFMVGIYRLLGVVAIVKLSIEAALLWSIVCWLGETQGLALTLAGVTGLIVSIGISVDSNIVYYEHLKEDVRSGRTLRSAADRSFRGAFRTIFAADFASLLGAALLWWLTIGGVRGFALFMGLATILDLLVSYFFMHPAVRAVLVSRHAERHPRLFGMPAGAPSSNPAHPNDPQPQPAQVAS